MPRFKIDLYASSSLPFALYFRRPSCWRQRWEYLDRFQTKDEAKAFYEKIKDLPEYLE